MIPKEYRFFSIDSLGKGVFVKCLFVILLLVKCSVYFFPLGDPDLSELVLWSNNYVQNFDPMAEIDLATIPFTYGNAIFICHELFANFILIMGGMLYAAVYIRLYRLERLPNKPGASGYLIPPRYLKVISVPALIGRFILLSLFVGIIFLPAAFFVLSFFLAFIIILPCVALFPACYLSGDNGLIMSFGDMVKVNRGYYFTNMRMMTMLLCFYFIGDYLSSALMRVLPSVAYVLGPAIAVYFTLVAGRYIGFIYCRIREIPGRITRNHASVK